MRLPERNLYVATLGAVMVLSLAAALLAFFGVSDIAFGFLALVGLLLPVVSHLRMRRSLAAIKKVAITPHAAAPDLANDRLLRIEESIRTLEHKLADIQATQSQQGAVSEISKQAQAVRREARLARLLNEETLKGLK